MMLCNVLVLICFLVFGEGYIDIKDDILWIGDDEFVLVDLNMLFV